MFGHFIGPGKIPGEISPVGLLAGDPDRGILHALAIRVKNRDVGFVHGADVAVDRVAEGIAFPFEAVDELVDGLDVDRGDEAGVNCVDHRVEILKGLGVFLGNARQIDDADAVFGGPEAILVDVNRAGGFFAVGFQGRYDGV